MKTVYLFHVSDTEGSRIEAMFNTPRKAGTYLAKELAKDKDHVFVDGRGRPLDLKALKSWTGEKAFKAYDENGWITLTLKARALDSV